MLKVKKLFPDAKLPVKAHDTDLGFDLFAHGHYESIRGSTFLVDTGIACEFPPGYGALIRDRSSVATKQQMFVVAGVIDQSYTGHILVAIHAPEVAFQREEDFVTIEDGTKIAQMILVPVVHMPVVEVDELGTTDRGTKGFGSTGV